VIISSSSFSNPSLNIVRTWRDWLCWRTPARPPPALLLWTTISLTLKISYSSLLQKWVVWFSVASHFTILRIISVKGSISWLQEKWLKTVLLSGSLWVGLVPKRIQTCHWSTILRWSISHVVPCLLHFETRCTNFSSQIQFITRQWLIG